MRRGFVFAAAGLVAAVVAGAVWLDVGRGPDVVFEPRAGAPGFRTLSGAGGVSAGSAIGTLLDTAGEAAEPETPADLCQLLWRSDHPAQGPLDGPRLAVFSDANCPYCRRLDGTLEALAEDRPDLRIVHHEWPALGPASVLAARAALAADLQGGFRPMQRRLLQSSFVPTPAYLRAAAEAQGLDADRLLKDMDRPEVAERLGATQEAARRLGLHGTPSLVIGGAVAEGALDRGTIEAALAAEARRASPACP